MVALVLDGLVGFPAGLSPTSFHLSPSSFLLSPSSFHFLSPRLGACGRVPGWLVSHFLSFVSHFFSFVSQFFSFVSPGWVLVVGFPAGLSPTSFHLSPTSFHLSPTSFHLSPTSFHLSGWVLVVGFAAGLSPTCFHLSPTSFICLPGWVLVVGFLVGLSPTSFHLSPNLSPRLGSCGRVSGWLVSHFLSYVSLSFVSQGSGLSPFLSFVSQAGCLWSGSRLACLPLPVICLPGWVLVVGFPAGLSPTSGHLSPRLGACGRVPGWLVSHFLSFVSQFVSQAGRLWSGFRLACLPRAFICLPGWVLVVGFAAGLSPTSFHMSPTSFHLSPRVPGWLVSHFLSFVSHFFSFVSQFFSFVWVLAGWLVSYFLSFVSHFFSFVSQAGCLWSGLRLACLPLPFICLPLLFICLPVLFICLQLFFIFRQTVYC